MGLLAEGLGNEHVPEGDGDQGVDDDAGIEHLKPPESWGVRSIEPPPASCSSPSVARAARSR